MVQKGWTPGLGRGQVCRAMWKKAQLKLSSTLPSFQFQPQFLPLALQPSSPDTQGLHLTQVQTGVLLRAVRWCLRAQFNILCPAAPASRCGPRITEFTPPQPGSFHSPLRPRPVSLPFTRLLDLTTTLSYNKNPFFCQNKSFAKGHMLRGSSSAGGKGGQRSRLDIFLFIPHLSVWDVVSTEPGAPGLARLTA